MGERKGAREGTSEGKVVKDKIGVELDETVRNNWKERIGFMTGKYEETSIRIENVL